MAQYTQQFSHLFSLNVGTKNKAISPRRSLRNESLLFGRCVQKIGAKTCDFPPKEIMHRLNMELDRQSLFGLHVHSCILIGWDPATPPPPPPIWSHIRGRYWSAKIDDISLWPPGIRSHAEDNAKIPSALKIFSYNILQNICAYLRQGRAGTCVGSVTSIFVKTSIKRSVTSVSACFFEIRFGRLISVKTLC